MPDRFQTAFCLPFEFVRLTKNRLQGYIEQAFPDPDSRGPTVNPCDIPPSQAWPDIKIALCTDCILTDDAKEIAKTWKAFSLKIEVNVYVGAHNLLRRDLDDENARKMRHDLIEEVLKLIRARFGLQLCSLCKEVFTNTEDDNRWCSLCLKTENALLSKRQRAHTENFDRKCKRREIFHFYSDLPLASELQYPTQDESDPKKHLGFGEVSARSTPSNMPTIEPETPLHQHIASIDSGFHEVSPSNISVTSAICNHLEEYGRSYHAYHDGKYYMSIDVEDVQCMTAMHRAIQLVLQDRCFYAPITDPQNILDVGTGPGDWCIAVADNNPGCMVRGFDIAPIQPNKVPPNCSFEIFDAEDPWTFRVSFDLIHTRFMYDLTLESWPRFLGESFKHLRPGGWLEMHELDLRRYSDDGSVPLDSPFGTWGKEWHRALRMLGRGSYCDPNYLMRQIREAGFVNVQYKKFRLPIGPWLEEKRLNEAGNICMAQLLIGLPGLSVKCFRDLLGYDNQNLEMLLMESRKDIAQEDIHAWWPLFVIYGQKLEA